MEIPKGNKRPDEVGRAYESPRIRTLESREILDALGPAFALYDPATGGLGKTSGVKIP